MPTPCPETDSHRDAMSDARPTPDQAAAFSPGDTVGCYELERHIHGGAFGQVWIGRHRHVGYRRAVKVFGDNAHGQFELRGVREYLGVADRQVGLVPVFEVDVIPGKGYYYTMPLADDVKGKATLRDPSEYEPMTLQRYREMHRPARIDAVLPVALHLLPSLHALHEAHLVHRDVKPANVVRVKGMWRLCDVGLISRRDHIQENCGTPGFTPPEGVQDRRADVYAFGVTLYLLVTEHRVQQLDDFRAGRLTVGGGDDRAAALQAILVRACHPDPRLRFQTAIDVHHEISRLVRTTRLTVVLDAEFASFTPARLEEFIEAVRERDFHIHGAPVCEEGSVRVTLELYPDDADKLAALVEAGEFDRFRAVRAEFAEPRPAARAYHVGPAIRAGFAPDDPGTADALPRGSEPRPVDDSDPGTDAPSAPVAGWESPQSYLDSLPGFEVIGPVLRGPLANVYQARQLGIDRRVALKVLPPVWADDPHMKGRFEVLAKALARAEHPNVVRLYEFRAHLGIPFLTMEYCGGGTLSDRTKAAALRPEEAAGVVEVLARAVAVMHQAGVIHRDLKPRNVVFTEDGTPKISDFGLAKLVPDGPRLTSTGAILGTPAYMAPEQARGDGNVGPLADVHGLGAILYECLTGRPPFQAATVIDTLRQVVATDPVPPRLLNHQTPADLDTICLKCLSKEPARRYATAGELADDLHRFRTGLPVLARPAGRAERFVKWVRRHPWQTAVAVLAGVSLGLLGLLGWIAIALVR